MPTKQYNAFKRNGSQADRDISILIQCPNKFIDIWQSLPLHGIEIINQPEYIIFLMGLYGECRGEPNRGIELVASVIMNRFLSQNRDFGLSVKDVLLKHTTGGIYQFSTFNPKDKNYPKLLQPDAIGWTKCFVWGLPYYLGEKAPVHQNMLWYHATSIKAPYWTKELKVVDREGGHIFYAY